MLSSPKLELEYIKRFGVNDNLSVKVLQAD